MTLEVVLVPIAYLAGSIPTGVILARTAGVDVQREGSGNVGATNVARTAGKRLGILTLVGDAAKGALPVGLAHACGASEPVVAATALAAIVGHVYSVFLGLRGGKGVATALGALIALAPAAAPLPVVAFALAFGLSRIVSVASIVAAVVAPLAVLGMSYPKSFVVASIAIAALIVWKHRENIERMRAGTEARFRAKS